MTEYTSEIQKMLQNARDAPVEFETDPLDLPGSEAVSPVDQNLFKNAYEIQEEIATLKKKVKKKQQILQSIYDEIKTRGVTTDPENKFRFITKTRRGNQFIIPSKFIIRFPDIFEENIDTLVTINIKDAEGFIPRNHLDGVMDRKPDTKSNLVEYIGR